MFKNKVPETYGYAQLIVVPSLTVKYFKKTYIQGIASLLVLVVLLDDMIWAYRNWRFGKKGYTKLPENDKSKSLLSSD